MKGGTYGLFLILLTGVCHCQYKDGCSLDSKEADIYFPDISKIADIAYQMEVEFTMPNQQQTDYFVEYRDIYEKKGRIDYFYDYGVTEKYYYYSDASEAFEISEKAYTCEERNESSVPEFMKLGMDDWYYSDKNEIIHGPSAMFKIAFEADKNNHSKVRYMGVSANVRGIPAQYWRRCLRKNLTADYFFSVGKREGIFGLQDVTLIPLRIQIYGVSDLLSKEDSKIFYPQNYEFMTFTPFLNDPYYTFELPVGRGCGRKPREDDTELPDFGQQSLYIEGEAVYTDYAANGIAYSSNFVYAFDIDSEYLSYFSTPWVVKDGKKQGGVPVYVVYDTRNKYVYNTSFADGSCTIGNTQKFIPKYSLPGGDKGFVSLTDPSMFYPNDEFYYLGEGVDRGYKVDIFEVLYREGYLLGDRVVQGTTATHYYLKKDEAKVGPRVVEDALTRIRLGFNGTDDSGGKMNAVLNFNLNKFSTRIDQKAKNFYITQCFRDEDDIMYITVGFTPEEDADLDLISEDIPSAVENARSFMREVVDLPPARLPGVFTEFRADALYVTYVILERAPYQLDFNDPKANTYISGASQTQGITGLLDCAYLCLDTGSDCWGFAHCGATCYVGAGERSKAKLENKSGCQYYNRTNFEIVPRLKMIRRSVEGAVTKGQPRISVAKNGGGVINFTPKYIEDADFGESAGVFDVLGMETSPRLRVVKVGTKLASGTGENISKNFGKLTYGECQRMCLDFKPCETVSYCANSGECVLSLTHAEDIGADKFKEDNMCNVLTRKYSDAFTRSPGDVLSQSARKILDTASEEDCAKACMKEKSFDCLSFDSCRTTDGKQGCRLHAVHILDLVNTETEVKKESICGHYSRKYTYDFKRQSKRKAVGSGFVLASGVNTEQCAKLCIDYNQGECNGFDACQGKGTPTTCVGLSGKISDMKTTYNEICDHFERSNPIFMEPPKKSISKGVAGGVGFLLFVIGCALGALIVYGVAYYRVNRSR